MDVKQHPTNPRKINLGTTSLHFTWPLTCRELVQLDQVQCCFTSADTVRNIRGHWIIRCARFMKRPPREKRQPVPNWPHVVSVDDKHRGNQKRKNKDAASVRRGTCVILWRCYAYKRWPWERRGSGLEGLLEETEDILKLEDFVYFIRRHTRMRAHTYTSTHQRARAHTHTHTRTPPPTHTLTHIHTEQQSHLFFFQLLISYIISFTIFVKNKTKHVHTKHTQTQQQHEDQKNEWSYTQTQKPHQMSEKKSTYAEMPRPWFFFF